MKRILLAITFLLIAVATTVPVWATEVLVIGTADNITGHEVGMRNTILSESGLDAANVKICYTGSSDAEGHDPDIHIRVTGDWPNACIDYAVANGYELTSTSYTGFSSTINEYIAAAFRSSDIGAVYATTADVTNPIQFYTTTPGQENPDDTAGSIASNYLEFRTYDSGSLSIATARTAGIIAYLMENASFNYWDARAAIRENSSQWNTWDKDIGFGYVDITAAKAESNAALLALQPPIIKSIEVNYTTSATTTIEFEHFHQTRWDSTKFVYFTSEPAPTAAPGDADGEICDITNAATTTCTWSDILPGTYYIVGYTEETTNYSTIQDEFLSSAITVVTQTPMPITGGWQFYDETDNTWTPYADLAALDAAEYPSSNDIIDGGANFVTNILKNNWDAAYGSPLTLRNVYTTRILAGDNWCIERVVVLSNSVNSVGIVFFTSSLTAYTVKNSVVITPGSGTKSISVDLSNANSTLDIQNSIIAAETSTDISNVDVGVVAVSNSIYTDSSGTVVDGGGNLVGVDPLFIDTSFDTSIPTLGNFGLQSNSAAIRRGTGTLWNGIPCSIGAIQQTKGVVGSSTFFGNYKLGDAKNECTIE
jgi:hypothetical protein